MTIKERLGFTKGDKFDLSKAIDFHLENNKNEFRERDYFYMSEAGKCPRQLYLDFKNKKAFNPNARVKRILENGDYVHKRFQSMFAEMGILIGAEIEPPSNGLINGRADAIITDGEQNYVVDIKSASQWSFNPMTSMPEEYKTQLLLYMYFLNIPNGILLVENKDNQAIKEFRIQMHDDNRQYVLDVLEKLKKLKEQIYVSEEPICEGNLEKCKYCDYKNTCPFAVK